MTLKATCNGEQFGRDISRILTEHDAFELPVMVELDDHAQPVLGIRIDTIKLPDGSLGRLITIVGGNPLRQ